jgi:dihydroneopterin aldolase
VFEHERLEGQEFVVDVTLGVDTRPAGAEDDLAKTVDYGRLTLQIRKAIESDPVNLIETLADRVAERCLGDPLVQWVEVTVHKPHAPIGVPFDDVTLTILRSRQ